MSSSEAPAIPRCSREEVGSPGFGRPIGGWPAIASARSSAVSSAMAASLAESRASSVAYGRPARTVSPQAALAQTSCSAGVASPSARVLNRVRPGVELEVTGASVAVFRCALFGLRIANALRNTTSTLC
ncbi:protein of unknown function [Streptomyces sp. KY75]|nr:protein of unknown function [Streptomyces sp. KY70]CAD5989636.1 protein of unknown function [Streptomyces sp. KY75]